MKKFLLLALVLVAVNQCFAQKKAGRIEYEISFPDAEIPADQMAMMPSEAIVYFKDEISRTEMKMGMGMNMVTIHSPKQTVMLMDMMGKKIAIKQPVDSKKADKDKNSNVDIKLTDETKQIAGYSCKKAIINGSASGQMTVWFTDQIQSPDSWSDDFAKLKGTALEFDLKTEQITMHMLAQSVNFENPAASLFEIPAEYKEMSPEELKTLFGGNE